jgi:hypothetical protein
LTELAFGKPSKVLMRRSLTPSRRLRPSRSRAEVIRNGAIRQHHWWFRQWDHCISWIFGGCQDPSSMGCLPQ